MSRCGLILSIQSIPIHSVDFEELVNNRRANPFHTNKNISFTIPKRFPIVLYCAVPASLPPAFPIKQLQPHAHSVAAVHAVCRRDCQKTSLTFGSRSITDHQYKSQACSFTTLGCAVVSRQSFIYLVLLHQLLNSHDGILH